ncbi:MAG: DDE-type integrase/transposase/recombinase, partial [Gammaproteobacteria bacterium]|nr:DDE-type integrase/transposase/recombinase [Gammaproteobacteria bacterium]
DSEEDTFFVKSKDKKGRTVFTPAKKSSSSRHSDRRAYTPTNPKPCYRCGNPADHAKSAGACPARGKTCENCGKPDHFAKVCRSKTSTQASLSVSIGSIDVNALRYKPSITLSMSAQKKGTNTEHSAEISFLADTGADVSTMTWNVFQDHFPKTVLLKSNRKFNCFGGSSVRALGKIEVATSWRGGSETQLSIFVVPNVCMCLLGYQDMAKMHLIINPAKNEIRQDPDYAEPSDTPEILSMSTEDEPNRREQMTLKLKAAFPAVFSPAMGKMRNFEHRIQLKPNSVPVHARKRPVPFSKKQAMKEEIQKGLDEGTMELVPGSRTEWNSPVHGVNKPDGGLRVTVGFSKTLNPCVIPTVHSVPMPAEIFEGAKSAKVLSKIDLRKAYWHIRLSKDSRPLTAFHTDSHGMVQFTRLPMGLSESGAVFQRASEKCLEGLDGVFPYFDDILVTGDTHDERLLNVFGRLERDGFRVGEEKLSLSKRELSMLGHILRVTSSGLEITPDLERTATFLASKPPTGMKKLQEFLGMAGYYSNYIPHYSTIAEPLFRLKRKNSERLLWDDDCDKAFKSIKECVASPEVLVPYDPNCPLHIHTDASLTGLGAVLAIDRCGEMRPVAFASKCMTAAERNYSTPEQEALATVWALEKWNQFTFGHHFSLHTDQQSLLSLARTFGDDATKGRRIQRWCDRLKHYDYTVKHVPGKDNVVADWLSRLHENESPSDDPTLSDDDDEVTICFLLQGAKVSPNQLREESMADPMFSHIRQFLKLKDWPKLNTLSGSIRKLHAHRSEISERDGLLYKGSSLIIPASLQNSILLRLHSGHPGIERMKRLYRELYFWDGGSTDCEHFVRNCVDCAYSENSAKTTNVPPGRVPVPSNPWEQISIDISGPFWTAPTTQENIIVVMDYFSKWPEYFLTQKATSMIVIKFLTDLFARFGNPLELLSDNGPQFTSDEFENFCADRNIKHTLCPVYTPERNGLVERMNRNLKNSAQIADHSGQKFADAI